MDALPGAAKYVIDPKKYRTDYGYLGCMGVWWLVWAPATLVLTYIAITQREPLLYLFLIFGYVGTLIVPVVFFGRHKVQSLEVVGKKLVVCGTGLSRGSKYEMPAASLRFLTLEYYQSGNDGESVMSLNLLHSVGGGTGRVMLAQFVHPDDKEVLLEEIRRFLKGQGLEFEVKNTDMKKK
jgi:hypothetical protein